ncbi:MAG: helicase [Rhodobacteraceae bacterium]|nr:helicase [Paracoccaceae bacterium]MYI91470.1 helicase [Paracoccaceae bacterium]
MKYPSLIDNKEENTLAQALRMALGFSGSLNEETTVKPDEVRIATAYFNPTGFAHISDHLCKVKDVRLLLGADLTFDRNSFGKRLDETIEAFELRNIKSGLSNQTRTITRERDQLPFNRTTGRALRKLINALREGNLEVRRYEKEFLHAKAYIFSNFGGSQNNSSGIIVGSSNLTGAGLTRNRELNLQNFDKALTRETKKWFDELWEGSEPYDLAKLFEVVFEPALPWIVFVRVLWKLYGKEIIEDAEIDENLPLTSFQKHGVARALRLIRETGGVIVADEVGLGKTFIAGEILQIYRERRQRALLICPASLRDSTWRHFQSQYQLFVECLSFEQLANEVQLRDQQRPNADKKHLQRQIDEYQLVIVDEAHNYRNPDTPSRAAALRKLLFGKKRDLLLLTATPVNNSLWDLYHLLRYFLRQDAHFASRGILSIREKFKHAMRMDPSELNPELLYPIIDATTVKRTRQFIKKHYANDTIPDTDGRNQTIVFPKPNAISMRYNLDEKLPGLFDKLEEALNSEGNSQIRFARYTPNNYLIQEEDNDEKAITQAMVGLLRSGLLKRFESSTSAFSKTANKMVNGFNIFLKALDHGYVVNSLFLKEISADDETLIEDLLNETVEETRIEELLERTENKTEAILYDVDILRADVEKDIAILSDLAKEANSISPNQDPKLRELVNALIKIAQQAKSEAIDSVDETQRRKVLVFSYFEDTVKWIYDFLNQQIKENPDLAPYLNRLVVVSGSDKLTEIPRLDALQGFAPVSMGAPSRENNDLYDIIVATDVLAEGVNLQQCRHIINFDMPWNPMRLVQRHGRIDRIGSPHKQVFMRTIFPADRLDDLLKLEQRILDKIAQAAASIGVQNPIEGAARGNQVFSETREEIEKLIKEDATLFERGGTAGAAQTGEEYRQTLRKVLDKEGDLITNLPWKTGTGMVKGERSGIFFCAVVGSETNFERTYLRFIPAQENWQPSSDANDYESEIGICLQLIECEEKTELWFPDHLERNVYDFWELARENIWESWMEETDPANFQPKIRPLNHRVAEFIREQPLIGKMGEQTRKALNILESPWPRREEIMLRGWFQTDEYKGEKLANILIQKIIDTGIEPTTPPLPLPPIELKDVELLCWIGIQSELQNYTQTT